MADEQDSKARDIGGGNWLFEIADPYGGPSVEILKKKPAKAPSDWVTTTIRAEETLLGIQSKQILKDGGVWENVTNPATREVKRVFIPKPKDYSDPAWRYNGIRAAEEKLARASEAEASSDPAAAAAKQAKAKKLAAIEQDPELSATPGRWFTPPNAEVDRAYINAAKDEGDAFDRKMEVLSGKFDSEKNRLEYLKIQARLGTPAPTPAIGTRRKTPAPKKKTAKKTTTKKKSPKKKTAPKKSPKKKTAKKKTTPKKTTPKFSYGNPML